MFELLFVFIGGGIGASLRYLLSGFVFNFNNAFLGTLIINVVGCLFLGFVSYFAVKNDFNNNLKLFLTTGIAGGFTTFSTFSLETFKLFQSNETLIAFSYMFASLFLGLASILIGISTAKGLDSFVIKPIFAYQEEDIIEEAPERELVGSVED